MTDEFLYYETFSNKVFYHYILVHKKIDGSCLVEFFKEGKVIASFEEPNINKVTEFFDGNRIYYKSNSNDYLITYFRYKYIA